MKKKLPKIKTNKAAEEILNQDLSAYINKDNFKSVSFEFLPKTEQINIRVSKPLIKAIKNKAKKQKMQYQKYVRLILEKVVTES